jgi:hypothetical protein
MTPEMKERLEWYKDALQKLVTAYRKKNFRALSPEVVDYTVGRKYARFFTRGSQSMCHSFVDLSNGNLLRPDGWKRPTLKNPRGSLFDKDPMARVNAYSVDYIHESNHLGKL